MKITIEKNIENLDDKTEIIRLLKCDEAFFALQNVVEILRRLRKYTDENLEDYQNAVEEIHEIFTDLPEEFFT